MPETPFQDKHPANRPSSLPHLLLRAIDSLAETVVLTDPACVVIHANQTMLKQYGYDADELTGRPITSLWVQPNAVTQQIMAELCGNRTWQGRIQHKAKEGNIFEETVTISPVVDEHGTVTNFIKTGRVIDTTGNHVNDTDQIDTTYRNILDLMRDGYIEIDLKGTTTFLNKSAARIYQRSREEMIGLNYKAYTTPEESERLFHVFNEVYRTGESDRIIEYEVMGKDGAPISLETLTTLLRDNQGNPVGFGGVTRDVTEKKRLITQLKESEESYRRVMELAPDAITITRVSDGKYFEVNDTFCQQTGYSREEVIGRTVEDLKLYAAPEDRQRLVNALRSDGQVSGMRVNFRHKDGSPLYDIVSARMITFKGEECLLFVGTLINSLVETQQALEESEKRYRNILNAAPDIICLTRLSDGRYIEANKKFYQNTGWTPEETIGNTAVDLNIYADPNDRQRLLEALRKTGQVDNIEIRTRYKNGRITYALWSCRTIEYNGEPCLLVVAKEIDELKKAQMAMQEREAQYRTVLNTAPYPIVISRRADTTYVEVNAAFTRQTGYSREEAIGRTPFDLTLYDDPTDHHRLLTTLSKDGLVASMEIRFRDRQGGLIEGLISASPIMYQGEPCLLTITVDISELKRTQRELAMSEESYRTIMEAAPNAMEVLSIPDLKYVAVNDAFCKSLGYSKEEVTGKTAQELKLLTEQQVGQVVQLLQRDGRIDNFEIHAHTKDGRILHSLLSIAPIRHMGQRCFLTSNVDVTELIKVESALRESETRFRTIFETAADAIFVTNLKDGRFLDVNRAACEHLGQPAATLMTMHLSDIISDRYPYQLTLPPTEDNPSKPIFFESMHLHKSGREIPVEVSCAVVERSGQPALLSIVRDVNERKQAEAELAKYRQHLEEMVQERTGELEAAQSELLKRERLSVLGQLTATVSHELRNPLGVIRSSNFYLKRKIKEKDEKVDKHIRRIEDQVGICDTIVADLLEYTRGRQASLEKQAITPWLKDVAEQMRETEHIDIAFEIENGVPAIPHDQEKMRRVVINLLDNAAQAVRARQETVRAERGTFLPAVSMKLGRLGRDLFIQVSDNGVGMDDETRKRAFEPLFTTRARGTGIGLANVSKIVSEHSGRIELESEWMNGTTVTILLPIETDRTKDKTDR